MAQKIPRGEMSPEERRRAQKREKETAYLRSAGRPVQADPARAVAHVRRLRGRGMAAQQMADQVGIAKTTITDLDRGRRTADKGGTPIVWIPRETEAAVLRIRYAPPVERGSCVNPAGTRRRLQALAAAGFTGPFIASRLGCTTQWVNQLTVTSGRVHVVTVQQIAALYAELAGSSGPDHGISAYGASRSRGLARRRGWAPPSCWDSDTIDDPEAIPEWTGRCGTVWGWRIHENEGIPACQPCIDAQGTASAGLSPTRLREARLRRQLAPNDVARLSGVKVDRYRSWESGRTKPNDQRQLDLVLAVLDVTYDEVCEE